MVSRSAKPRVPTIAVILGGSDAEDERTNRSLGEYAREVDDP